MFNQYLWNERTGDQEQLSPDAHPLGHMSNNLTGRTETPATLVSLVSHNWLQLQANSVVSRQWQSDMAVVVLPGVSRPKKLKEHRPRGISFSSF